MITDALAFNIDDHYDVQVMHVSVEPSSLVKLLISIILKLNFLFHVGYWYVY